MLAIPERSNLSGSREANRDQRARLLELEEVVLRLVEDIAQGQRIDRSAVFVYGSGNDGSAAAFVGLRNAHLFRAAAIHGESFEAELLAPDSERLEKSLPILLVEGESDRGILKRASGASEWLKTNDYAHVTSATATQSSEGLPSMAMDFYGSVREAIPTIAIRPAPEPGGRGYPVQLTSGLTGDRKGAFLWRFGDGGHGNDPDPWHVYANPGRYRVSLTIRWDDGGADFREAVVEAYSPDLGPPRLVPMGFKDR
jgi:hypothetical protein